MSTVHQHPPELTAEQIRIFLGFAEEITLHVGGRIAERFHNRSFSVMDKADGSPVTEADREAEEFLRNRIARAYPSHGIIGEEFGEQGVGSDFVWVIDPIDGTKSFVHGVPLFGTLLGLLFKGQPLIGVIHQPILGRLVSGDNREACLNGEPIRVRAPRPLAEATLLLTDPADELLLERGEGYQVLLRKAGLVRSWGDCFGYQALVMGLADVMMDPVLNPWDLLPLLPVLRGAGAAVSDCEGGVAERGNSLVAATCPELRDEIVQILSREKAESSS